MGFFTKLLLRRIAAYQNDLMETYYFEVENMFKQMRGWRHDYRNHIQTMKIYAAQGDLEAVQHYLDGLDADLKAVDMAVKTGNKMADAILSSKISLAQSKNIRVVADASISVALSLSEIDLCVILGNLFDNAIEASLALPEEKRLIRIYIAIKNTQLYISFTNLTAVKKRQKENGRFQSTKGRGHGFGLLRVDSIVQRCGGYLKRSSEDGAFTTEIMLPLLTS